MFRKPEAPPKKMDKKKDVKKGVKKSAWVSKKGQLPLVGDRQAASAPARRRITSSSSSYSSSSSSSSSFSSSGRERRNGMERNGAERNGLNAPERSVTYTHVYLCPTCGKKRFADNFLLTGCMKYVCISCSQKDREAHCTDCDDSHAVYKRFNLEQEIVIDRQNGRNRIATQLTKTQAQLQNQREISTSLLDEIHVLKLKIAEVETKYENEKEISTRLLECF